MNIKLTCAQKIRILNSDDVFSIMRKVLLRENKIDRKKEHFWVIGLASNNIDHLIITTTSYLSFTDTGLLAHLQESLKYVPPYEIAERIRKEERKLRREAVKTARERGVKKGRQDREIEMAKGMKQKGISMEVIQEISGLSIEEIEKL